MNNQQLYDTISDARLQGAEHLEGFILRAGFYTGAEVQAAVERATSIIQGVPELLTEVSLAAESRGIGLVVQPLLDHAAEYFLEPMDHAPELAFGMTGLLDDAYLALRLVHLVQQVYQPLVHQDVESQLLFLRDLLGPDLVAKLDAETGRAVLKLAMSVAALREQAGADQPLPVRPI